MTLMARGVVAYLGSIEDLTVSTVLQELERLCHDRQHMAGTLYDLVDGLGARRVVVPLLGRGTSAANLSNSGSHETK